MKVLICENPSSFYSADKEIKILDDKKNLFFFHPNTEKEITFNLPRGKYFTDNRVGKEKDFIPYPTDGYKGFEKGWEKNIQIFVCKNPNKATIFPETFPYKIFVDEKIARHKFRPLTMFVLSHEVSHINPEGRGIKCNSKEKNFCDLNGANYLIAEAGLNPSQITMASKLLYEQGLRGDCVQHAMSNYRR